MAACTKAGKDFSYYGLTSTDDMVAEAFAEYTDGYSRAFARRVISIVMEE